MAITTTVCSISFDSDVITKLDSKIKEASNNSKVTRSRVVNEILKYILDSPDYVASVVRNLNANHSTNHG